MYSNYNFSFLCVFLVIIGQELTSYAVQLRVASSATLENSNVTLYCTDGGAQLKEVFWLLREQDQSEKMASVARVGNSCITGPAVFLAQPIYSYRCHDGTEFSITVKNISRDMHGDAWTCLVNNIKSNTITLSVQVPVASVTISPTNDTVTVAENFKVLITCTTSECRPKPEVTLRIDFIHNVSEYTSTSSSNVIKPYIFTFQLTPNRTWNDKNMWCTASNKNDEVVSSSKIRVNVTYPPDGPPVIRNHSTGSEIRVVENSYLNLTCSVTGGNPLPQLKWNKNNTQSEVITGDTVTKSVLWLVTGTSRENVTCQYMHPFGTMETYVTVDVLCKPTPPTKYGHLNNSLTENSVTIWWEPGFGCGDTQQFVISHKTATSDTWTNSTTAPETLGQIMAVTVQHLESGTQYYILIYAVNNYGSVKIGQEIKVKTNVAKKTAVCSSVLGPAVGGGTGGVLVTLLTVLALILIRKRRTKKQEEKSMPKPPTVAEAHTYEHLSDGTYQQYQQMSVGTTQRAGAADNNKIQKVYANLRLAEMRKPLDEDA